MDNEIVYLGPFNPEEVVQKRRLPARNPAAYNRMLRLATSIAHSGAKVRIVSTGISMKVKVFKRVIHRSKSLQVEGIPVTILPAVGVPVLGFLAEPIILSFWLLACVFRQRPSALFVYNATLASCIAVMLASVLRIRVIYEVEDVPTWAVATGGNAQIKPRFFQNLSWLIASKLQSPLSNRILVPSKRFLDPLNLKENQRESALIVSGCVDVSCRSVRLASYTNGSRPLKILFAGKLEDEHGYDLLLGAIQDLLNRSESDPKIEFHICGLPNPKDVSFRRPPDCPLIRYHGFVSDHRYKELLADADIGLALQKSTGLFSSTRTPSKAYEFLAAGKLLIATCVGDLEDLFPRAAVCLRPETPSQLARLLHDISCSPELYLVIAERGLVRAQTEFSFQAVGNRLSALIAADS